MTTSFNDYKIMEMSAHRSGTLRPVSLSNFTQLLGASVDDSTVLSDIGFDFTFEGKSYSRVNVTSNGCVQLSGSGTSLLGVSPTMAAQEPQTITGSFADPVFAPWMGDLITAEATHRGGVYKHERSIGYGGHRETIFRFVNYGFYTNTSANAYLIVFEVVLNSLGGIAFNYAPLTTIGSPTGTDYVVGVAMEAQGSTPRYKFIKGSIVGSPASGSLTLPNDWPMRFNYERSYLITPPTRLVVASSPVVNVRTTR